MEQRRLQSQHSVAAFGTRGSIVSPLAKKLRMEPAHRGYKPVAFVKIDDTWTALRFRRS
jgi:hypothetical protein